MSDTEPTPDPASCALKAHAVAQGPSLAGTPEASRSAIEILARALWIEAGHVLLCRNIASGYWYLPGGHVEFGEGAADALRREIMEETGLAVRIGRCALVGESSFEQNGRHRHEVNLMFHVERDEPPGVFHVERGRGGGPSDGAPRPIPSLESHIAFDWVCLAGLAQADVRPAWLRDWVASRADNAAPIDLSAPPAWVSVMGCATNPGA